MKKIVRSIVVYIFTIFIIACTSFPAISTPPSATTSGPRVLILNEKEISEADVGGFISWYCKDFVYEGPVLVEVGFFGNPKLKGVGFILYDGGYSGEFTHYQRVGLEHRWDWGPKDNDFAFVIQSDGTGLYYDFTNVQRGQSTKASEVYKCFRRGN